MPKTVTNTYSQASLIPYKWPERVLREDYPVAGNAVIPLGGMVGLTTAANAIDVQTLTFSSPLGPWSLTFGNALQYTANFSGAASAATIQAALQALPNIGLGGITVSGASTTRTMTFAGALANQPQPLMTLNTTALQSGSITIAHTTQGVASGAITNYNGTLVAAPTTGPTLTATGSGGTIGAGTYEVVYTLVTAAGETTPSDPSTVTLTSAQSIQVTSITGLNAAVTTVNFYVDGELYYQNTPSGGATGTVTISAPPAVAGKAPPSTNTAYVASDGSQIPIGPAWYAMAADPSGKITFGSSAPTGNEYQPAYYTGNVAISGVFSCANLVTAGAAGVDQNTVNQLGRLIAPGLTTGVLLITGP